MKYDYLVVGAGLYGAVFAHEAKKKGKNCLVIDKRDHICLLYTSNGVLFLREIFRVDSLVGVKYST